MSVRSSPFRLDREAETLPRRLAIIIGTGLVLLAFCVWIFSDGAQEAEPAAPVVTPAPVAVPSAAQPVQAAAPVATSAEVTLYGVMGLGDNGSAIISVGNAQQRLVRTGRDIVPGMTLVAVAGDHITVLERGVETRIGFPDDPDGVLSAPPRQAGDPSRETMRAEVITYQRLLTPLPVEGRVGGYRLGAGEMPREFVAAGLQPGDIVIRVAGTRLEGPDDIARIPRAIRASDRVPIEFMRDGEIRIIYFGAGE